MVPIVMWYAICEYQFHNVHVHVHNYMYSQEVNFSSLFLFFTTSSSSLSLLLSSPIPSLLSFPLFLTFSLLPPHSPSLLLLLSLSLPPPTSPLHPPPPSPSSLLPLPMPLIHQERLAPNVLAMVQSFNQLALLVPTEILSEDTHQQRAKVISAYIQVLVYINPYTPGTLRTDEKMSYVLSTQM